MIVIPIGLGSRLRWAPWITTAMMLTWITNYMFDPFREDISDQLGLAASKTGIRDASRKLFIDYCIARKGSKSECAELSKLFWTGFPGKDQYPPKGAEKAFLTERILEKEFDKAEHLRESMRDCSQTKKPKSCIHYKEIFWKFSQVTTNFFHVKKPANLASLPSYRAYVSTLRDFNSQMLKICKSHECLTKENIKPASILLAQMRHGGFLHLIGNAAVFLVFAVYVEQKLRPILFFAAMLLTGSFGMFLHAKVWGTPDTFIIGGSTIVSGIIGLFFSLFFHRRLCLRVILPRKFYLGSDFYLPVKYVIPFLFVMSDVGGSMASGYNELGSSQVAHLAHLISFLTGSFFGIGILLLAKNGGREIYRQSASDLAQLEKRPVSLQTVIEAERLLNHDPTNELAMYVGIRSYFICNARGEFANSQQTQNEALHFVKTYFPVLIHRCLHNRKDTIRESSTIITSAHLSRLFDVIPPNLSLKDYLYDLKPRSLIPLALMFLGQEKNGVKGGYYHCLKVLDLLISSFPDSKATVDVEALIRDIVDWIFRTDSNANTYRLDLEYVKAYLKAHPQSRLPAFLLERPLEVTAS